MSDWISQKNALRSSDKKSAWTLAFAGCSAGLILIVLTLLLGQTHWGRPVLRIFSFDLDVRLLIVLFWMLGSSGFLALHENGTVRGLLLAIAAAFAGMFSCLLLAGGNAALILYLAMGVLLLFGCGKGAKRDSLQIALIASYYAIPLALYLLYVLSSSYAVNQLRLFANPQSDADGSGFLYAMIRSLLANTPLFGQSAVFSQYADELAFKMSDYPGQFTITRLVAQEGWAGGIAVLLLLYGASVYFMLRACATQNTFARCVSLGTALLFCAWTLVSTAASFALLPVSYLTAMPLIGSVPGLIVGLLTGGISLWYSRRKAA